MKKQRWPREAVVFRVDVRGQTCECNGAEVVGVGIPYSCFVSVIGAPCNHDEGNASWYGCEQLKALTPAARAMLAIAKASR